MDARKTFTRIYREARSSGTSGRMEFFRGAGAEVFVSDTGHLSVARAGNYADRPGAYASWLGSGSKYGRRYMLDRCRALPRVPLP